MKISHVGVKVSVLVLLGLVFVTYWVYFHAVSTLSEHMASLINVSNHLASGETFHSNVHTMLMDVSSRPDRGRFERDRASADKAIDQLRSYLGETDAFSAHKSVYLSMSRMVDRYAVFKTHAEKIVMSGTGQDADVRHLQELFDGIFEVYKTLHHHHSDQREKLLAQTRSLRDSIKWILTVQLMVACLVGALVILYLDRVVLKVYDLTERLALHDRLTGLYNRHALDRMVARLESDGKTKTRYGVILMDIDYFKRFNDTYGHPAGDRLLKVLSQRLTKGVRLQDKVVRYGGEEILVLLLRADIAAVRTTALKLCDAVARQPFDLLDGHSPKQVTVSAGYAASSVDEGAFDDLLNAADRRLYEAKETGRNRVVGPSV